MSVSTLLVDSLLVRCLLLPACLRLLGRRAWWLPSSLAWLHGSEGRGVAGIGWRRRCWSSRKRAAGTFVEIPRTCGADR
jgi:uncharacterized membrane protein YdfJ with MMPL/SSD domain